MSKLISLKASYHMPCTVESISLEPMFGNNIAGGEVTNEAKEKCRGCHLYYKIDLPEQFESAGNGYSQKDKIKAKTRQNRARDWKERGKSMPKAYAS
ncbi:hypothetical protein Tco_1500259 [Tanacetum coccineum]